MKTSQLLIAVAAAGAAFLIAKAFMKSRTASASRYTNSVENAALPGQPGWGWEYYDNGTAISPEGVYFYQGDEVWRPQ